MLTKVKGRPEGPTFGVFSALCDFSSKGESGFRVFFDAIPHN